VHDDSDEQVEEDGGGVLDARAVQGEAAQVRGLSRRRNIMLERDEDGGNWAGDLEHEPQHEHHRHARHDVCMVLDHKIVAEKQHELL